jgi:integrase/recombinase XerD
VASSGLVIAFGMMQERPEGGRSMTKLFQRMTEQLRLRNCSEDTIQNYLGAVQRFARYCAQSPEHVSPEQVRSYLLHLLEDRHLSWSAIHVNRSALRFLYVRVLKQPWFEEEIPSPKRPMHLPGVLSAEEVTRILDATRRI